MVFLSISLNMRLIPVKIAMSTLKKLIDDNPNVFITRVLSPTVRRLINFELKAKMMAKTSKR
jgi:hypothetical protein